MSLTRAVLIVSWCLLLAGIHAMVAAILGYFLPRSGLVEDSQRGFVMIAAAISAASMLLALLAVVYVQALWAIMFLSVGSLLLLVYGALAHSVPFAFITGGLLLAQFVFSRFAIGLNAIDNPRRSRINLPEEF